ncbi:hypothetical protein [Rosistilla oblonga]|uniref:hypothetical protein n=1 Tax=Rosistilla oblonga TaxID=2527990 RepID=UPI003A97613D
MKRFHLVGLRVAMALMVLGTLGCGPKSGVERHDLSGTVTFEGVPVPVGMVSFEPVEKGVGGGFAPIRNVLFDTADGGRGALSGPTSVRITGFDGIKDPSNPDAPPKALFEAYETTLDLADDQDEIEFALPLEGAQPN